MSLSPKVIIAAGAVGAVAVSAAFVVVPRLVSGPGPEQTGVSSDPDEPNPDVPALPKFIEVVLGPFYARSIDARDSREGVAPVLALLTVDEKLIQRVCTFAPRLVEAAVLHFESRPLLMGGRGHITFKTQAILMKSMDAAVAEELGEATVRDLKLHPQSKAISVRSQVKALGVGHLCVDLQAEKL